MCGRNQRLRRIKQTSTFLEKFRKGRFNRDWISISESFFTTFLHNVTADVCQCNLQICSTKDPPGAPRFIPAVGDSAARSTWSFSQSLHIVIIASLVKVIFCLQWILCGISETEAAQLTAVEAPGWCGYHQKHDGSLSGKLKTPAGK